MKLEVKLDGRAREIEARRVEGRWVWRLDGQALEADVAEICSGIYSILIGGKAFEVRVEESSDGLRVTCDGKEFASEVMDPRQWSRGRHGGHEAEGRQSIAAPMPGKIVRILVKAGDTVEAGQGLLVVEAMKMQNEIRAPKTGKVERLLVVEGQAVNAGEILVIVK